MGDDENRYLRKEIQRLKDYIESQSKRHAEDIRTLREDLHQETKYSKKLRAELDEEYKYCERVRKQLAEKTRLVEKLREDLEDERAYSEKLERKLDKRAKVIKELEADLLDLEDDYAEARAALKRMDQLRRELDDTKLHRMYEKQRVKQLQDEVQSLRSRSHSSSPAYTNSSLLYAPSHVTPSTQVHILGSSPRFHTLPTQVHVSGTSPRPHTPNLASQPPSLLRRISTPPSGTPGLESDYSDDEDTGRDGRLTEDDQETGDRESDASEYSDAEEEEAAFDANEAENVDDAPGQKLRNLAVREGRLADKEYERASDAHASGNKESAKKLRDSGAQHRHNMRNYHRLAAAEIFNHHNPDYNINPNARVKIDLHHLFVREAKEFVEKHIELCRRARLQRTEIISGRGNHSTGGVAKIRPAIMEFLEDQRDIEVDEHETNPGRIVVRFLETGGREDENIRPPSRMRDGPRRAEVEDVFEQGRTRLQAATRATADVRQGLDEIERGMSSMRLKPEVRRGLRDVTNTG